MKQIMDRVEFDFPPGGGTRLRMSKRVGCDKGRILCVDYGERRLGLALSDELRTIAQPLTMIDRARTTDAVGAICALVAPNQIGEIVVGMPFTLKGESAQSASLVTAFARDLNLRSGLPIVTWDERLSTRQSERALIESGMRRQKRKTKVDSVAAALILQSYLDAQKGK
jgi:putative Holliday junction resolvase